MKFLNNIDLQKNEIQNFRVQNLTAAPANPVAGQHYFNTVDKTEYVYTGTEWIDALSQGNYKFEKGLTVDENRTVTLDKATNTTIGGVIVGDNIEVNTDGKISVNDATATQKGLIQIATDEEAAAGTDETKAINAKQVKEAVADKISLTDLTAKGPVTYNNKTGEIAVDLDDALTADSTNLVNSGTIKAAVDSLTTELDKKVDKVTGKSLVADEDIAQITTNKEAISEINTKLADKADKTELPTKLSDLTDDSDTTPIKLAKGLKDVTATADELNTLTGMTENVKDALDAKLTKNEAIAGGTHTKITYDVNGLVTGGADLEASDIPDLSETYINVDQIGVKVAGLDENGKVPASQLPSYVDDVVDLLAIADEAPTTCAKNDKYYNATDKKIYVATDANTWGETGVDPEADKIYVNIANNMSYRWSGTTLVQIGADKLKGYTQKLVGDGATTLFEVNHNLGTRNVVFEVYEEVAPYEKIYVQVLHTSLTQMQVVFSQAPEVGTNYIVTAIAIG